MDKIALCESLQTDEWNGKIKLNFIYPECDREPKVRSLGVLDSHASMWK